MPDASHKLIEIFSFLLLGITPFSLRLPLLAQKIGEAAVEVAWIDLVIPVLGFELPFPLQVHSSIQLIQQLCLTDEFIIFQFMLGRLQFLLQEDFLGFSFIFQELFPLR